MHYMILSKQALNELHNILLKHYGEDFVCALSEEDLNQIGLFFLEVTVQGLKLRMEGAY